DTSHKSWPTGVRMIQLVAEGEGGGLVDSKDYGMVPPPCERRTWEATYVVPKQSRDDAVRLTVLAEDAAGKPTPVTAEFPVELQAKCPAPDKSTLARMRWGKWIGTIELKSEGGSYGSLSVDCFGRGGKMCELARQHGSWWGHGTRNGEASVEFFTVFAWDDQL